jgi:hypothetical protein
MLLRDGDNPRTELYFVDIPLIGMREPPENDQTFSMTRRGFLASTGALPLATCIGAHSAEAIGIVDIFLTMAEIVRDIASFFGTVADLASTLSDSFAAVADLAEGLEKELTRILRQYGEQPEAAIGLINDTPKDAVAKTHYARGPSIEFTNPIALRSDVVTLSSLAFDSAMQEARTESIIPSNTARVGLVFPFSPLPSNGFYPTATRGDDEWRRSTDAKLLQT